MKSPVSGCRMHVTVVIASGYKRTGLMCYHRHAASFWRWQNKRRLLLTRLLKHGHGLMRCTQRTMGRLSGIYALRKGHASMRIVGEWQLCDDGVTRPTVHAKVLGRNGEAVASSNDD